MCSCGQSRRVSRDAVALSFTTDFGVNVRRTIGFGNPVFQKTETDPFLLLSEYTAEEPAGFPDHPHRGHEIINYTLKGALRTEDFKGHERTVNPGDVQLITTGRGIVHCEMPTGPTMFHGLQIWINLPASDKMVTPSYKEASNKNLPTFKKDGVSMKILTGETQGLKSPVRTTVPTFVLEVKMDPKSTFTQPLNKDWTTLIYTLGGTIQLGPEKHMTKAEAHTTLLLADHGAHLDVHNKEKKRAHFIIVSGQPMKEPVFQHGPLIMSTEEDMKQAEQDVLNDTNGFEGGRTWESFIVREDDLSHP